jgi:4-aminobutyrate aminotransferase-like enzyme
MDAWPRSSGEALHTSTFLGNPMGCAMALASIELHLDPSLPKQVQKLGRYFRERLAGIKSDKIGNVRGIGLMIGVELVQDGDSSGLAAKVVRRGLKEGLIFLGGGQAGSVLSFTPPFTLSTAEIDYVCSKLYECLRFGSVS